MKKLTIEQKAERYDERLKNAIIAYKDEDKHLKATLERIFPELKEDENERIRKSIIGFLITISSLKDGMTLSNEDFDSKVILEWAAWLEKQGFEPNWYHHRVDLSNCSEEYRKAYYDGWNNCNMQHSQYSSEKNDVIKCLINGMKFYYEDNEEATWGTEKFSMKVKDILAWLEKQSEQKPIDGRKVIIRKKIKN